MSEVKFETWALVEIMGHQKYAGYVTEQTIAGSAFLQVDVPGFPERPAFTKLFSPGSVYAITPVTEQIARGVAVNLQQQPITVWDLPDSMREKLRGLPVVESSPPYDDSDDYDDSNCYDPEDD